MCWGCGVSCGGEDYRVAGTVSGAVMSVVIELVETVSRTKVAGDVMSGD